MWEMSQIATCDARKPLPLGKFKVEQIADIKFYATTPRIIKWIAPDGTEIKAVLSQSEAKKGKHGQYKISDNQGRERMAPVAHVADSLTANPPTETIRFALADLVHPV
jgi:hypothetical protein